jgi:hypothetical protein
MSIITCWITDKNRVETLKAEFANYYSYEGAVNPLTVTEEEDGSHRIDLENIRSVDLLHLFHAGIQFGMDTTKKYS